MILAPSIQAQAQAADYGPRLGRRTCSDRSGTTGPEQRGTTSPKRRGGVPGDPDRGQVQVRSAAGRRRARDVLRRRGVLRRPEQRDVLEHLRAGPDDRRLRPCAAVRHIRLLDVHGAPVARRPRILGQQQLLQVIGPPPIIFLPRHSPPTVVSSLPLPSSYPITPVLEFAFTNFTT